MIYLLNLVCLSKSACLILLLLVIQMIIASDDGSPRIFIKLNQNAKQVYIEQHYNEMVSNLEEYLSIMINKGDLNTLQYFINELKKKKTSYKTELNKAMNQKIKKIETIYKKLKYKDTVGMQTASPSFEWAENKFNVMINIFYSAKLNSISCPEIDNPKFVIKKDKQKIHFEGKCILEEHQIHFVLDLTLYDNISKVESTKIERGVYKVVLQKDVQSEWDRLLKGGERLPSNSFKMY